MSGNRGTRSLKFMQITPILMADDVDRSVAFYRDSLGFELIDAVMHGNKMSFATLRCGELELMLQSHGSLAEELPGHVSVRPQARFVLYMDVSDIDALFQSVEGKVDVIKKPHLAPHGQREFYVRDPSGYIIGFAQP